MAVPTSVKQLARGFAMGTADIVPGVSGGTVALVLGIYVRLIDNIHHAASAARGVLAREPATTRAELRQVEIVWLGSLLAGILVAVAALSSALEHLLEEQAVPMSGLFFGLVLGSVIVAWRLVRRITARGIGIMFVVAAGLFGFLGLREQSTAGDAAEIVTKPLWVFFLAGSIAICAMILPGISGSFLLVMMGMYTEVLGAVNDRDLLVILVFGLGCAVGLGLFSSVLDWALDHHHDTVMAAMIGLMLGSLRVLWPWPDGVDSTALGSPSGDVPIALGLAVLGFVVVIVVELVVAANAQHDVTPAGSPAAG